MAMSIVKYEFCSSLIWGWILCYCITMWVNDSTVFQDIIAATSILLYTNFLDINYQKLSFAYQTASVLASVIISGSILRTWLGSFLVLLLGFRSLIEIVIYWQRPFAAALIITFFVHLVVFVFKKYYYFSR